MYAPRNIRASSPITGDHERAHPARAGARGRSGWLAAALLLVAASGLPGADGPGLLGVYYDSQDLTDEAAVHPAEAVDLAVGGGSPDPAIGPDTFSVRWSGSIAARFSEPYTISVVADDGVRVRVDGVLVIDQWHDQSAREWSATVALDASRRIPIVVEYYEHAGAAVCRLFWSSAHQPREVVPMAALFPPADGAGIPPRLAPPTITPPGGSFTAPVAVALDAPPASLPVTDTALGFKHPGLGVERAEYLSYDGIAPQAIRLSTAASAFAQFPGLSVRPAWGQPLYFWSLATLVGDRNVTPGSRWGFTDSESFDGNLFDFFHGQTGNRVFAHMQGEFDLVSTSLELRAVADGVDDPGTPSHRLADFGRWPLATFASRGLALELSGSRARLVLGGVALTSAQTDADGWVGYTGTAASGRPLAPLAAQREWVQLDGNYDLGRRELIVAPRPRPGPARIHWTLDGVPVTGDAPLFASPIPIDMTTVLMARVYRDGFLPSDPASAAFTFPDVAGGGGILREFWDGIPGLAVAALTSNPRYPDHPTARTVATRFEAPKNIGDSYGTRMRGYVHPPMDGDYVFWISSDDNGELLLSTDDLPEHRHGIASVPGWTPSRVWDKYPQQRSAVVYLLAGQRYYIEALQKENAGGDNLAVGWQLPDGTLERPIPGSRLTPWVVGSPPTVASAATATPDPVPGTSTTLHVLGADDGGEPALIYTWSVLGSPPGPVTFTANGGNAAKTISAGFAAAGTYSFRATITDAQGLTATSDVLATVVATPVEAQLVVSPPSATVPALGTLPFSATAIHDQFGHAFPIAWMVSGGGAIDASGLFTAGSSAGGPFVVTATAGGRTGTAQVSVTSSANATPVVVDPAHAAQDPLLGVSTGLSVLGGDDGGEAALTYTWSVLGTPPAPVAFSDNGGNAAKHVTATFASAGTYAFRVVIADVQGANVASEVTVHVEPVAVETQLVVTPAAATIAATASQLFAAGGPGDPDSILSFNPLHDQFGHAIAPAWTVSGGGTIDALGLFTAGGSPGGPFTVTATAGGLTGTAAVTVVPANAAPTVATAATAAPAPVTGTSTMLSVLGADDGGEPALTYTWSLVGTPPGSVGFGTNGGNSAKTTIATFSAPGSYLFRVAIADAQGAFVTSEVPVEVVATPVEPAIVVAPPTATLAVGSVQAFSAALHDQFGNLLPVAWSVSGGGVIATDGRFTAGSSPGGPFVVTATAGGLAGTATVSVSDQQPPVVTISAPLPGEVLTTVPVHVAFSVTGSALIDEIRVNSILVVSRPGTSTFSGSIDLDLADGERTIEVTALNVAGLSASASRTVTVAARPLEVLVISPADGAVVAEQNVYVRVQVPTLTAAVTINGSPARRIGYVAAAWVRLAVGANTITAVASEAGRTGSDAVSITFAPPNGYDPNGDADGDGIPNQDDLFPLDPNNHADGDGDGVGDNSDPDPADPTVTSGVTVDEPALGQVIHTSY